MVSTARPADHSAFVTLQERPATGVLVHETDLGAGIRAEADLLRPDRWRAVTVPPAFARHPAAAGGAMPWLRIGVVDALDRWLTLSARPGARGCRARCRARTRRPDPSTGLRGAPGADGGRAAAGPAGGHGGRLRAPPGGPAPGAPPPRLTAVLQDLVAGYAELHGELSGPDRALSSVVAGWQRLTGRGEPAVCPVPPVPAAPDPVAPPRLLGRSLLDPRQLRSRILALASDPAEPEIDLVAPRTGDLDSVEVRVRAAREGRVSTPRLLVRLVNRRSGEVGGHAVLRRVTPETWAAPVPLYGLDPADVRADVADVLSGLPPARDDADADLVDARRAVVFLAEWRRLAGAAQCSVATPAPARHLRDLAARLHAHRARRDAALFVGGPSYAELNRLADLRDDELVRRLCGDGPIGVGLRALTSGAAGLLVAEAVALLVVPAD